FLGSDQVPTSLLVLLLIRWLVFRLEFGAGMIKMRGDRSWRDLTALYYHHETQPMPNPVSRFAHLLPKWFHRLEVLANHIVQLVLPWLLFAPQPIATVAAAAVILTQAWLVITGNFAWLNVITIVLAFSAVSDSALGLDIPTAATTPLWFIVVTFAVTALILVLSWAPARNLFQKRQLMNASFNRWHLVNAYGAFGTVTQQRYEVIIEGTADATVSENTDWREYEFPGKPGDPARMPPQVAPYHHRLGWLLWFLALGSGGPWFTVLLVRILEGDPGIRKLMRVDPFDGQAPRFVRARLFSYRFATRAEKRDTGLRWIRQPVDTLVPPSALRRPAEPTGPQ
ncbi:MAG TPA: lipase maturation factor family protein, partial [Glaciihabitans sp.]|nr:lipase maturation factor family protein [Glaciihabitans sp.]